MREMKHLLGFLLVLQMVWSCKGSENDPTPDPEEPEEPQEETYKNPVFKPVLADPTVIRAGEYFYAYGTEDDWGSSGGYHLVPIVRSTDLVNWSLVGDALATKPGWKQEGGIWAPDVTPVGDEYHMYYSYSAWGDPDPGIGLAIAQKPEGPFEDQGKVFLSSEVGVANSIDPFYIEEDGKKYLFWGSFHGIYAIELTDDGRGVQGEKIKIADTHLEAAYVYEKEGDYYLFGSEGSCCEGANSTYRVQVGRSESLLGPYLDKEGNNLATGHFGELLLEANDEAFGFAGPGHNAEIITDDAGTDWLLYHAIAKGNPLLENGASRRPLMLDKISWENGWPLIEGQEPGLTAQPVPVFE